MPRKKPFQYKVAVLDIPNDSPDLIKSFDGLVGDQLKSSGRGNRTKLDKVAKLIIALKNARSSKDRLAVPNLNLDDFKHPAVIDALDDLGVLVRAVPRSLLEEYRLTGILPLEHREAVIRAAQHYLKQATKYIK